jgi:membrane peptidoglycan carboxypeptidase
MQLAKNLYLERDKTASRKLQEAVLTLLLEQTLTKDQLMELYLNVIEFGPGVYGIGPAAAYYFNSTASQLSLGQSLYLASILPSPGAHHFQSSGEVTDKWLAYLHKLMRIAHKIGRINDAELDEGLREIIVFRQPYEPTPLPLLESSVPEDTALFGPEAPPSRTSDP